jgi:hypothetical protein
MTLTDDAVAAVESAYLLVQRYEETRDAALNDDRHLCNAWLLEATRILANSRKEQEDHPHVQQRTNGLEPMERIANLLEAVMGATEDGTPYLRVVTGSRK